MRGNNYGGFGCGEVRGCFWGSWRFVRFVFVVVWNDKCGVGCDFGGGR